MTDPRSRLVEAMSRMTKDATLKQALLDHPEEFALLMPSIAQSTLQFFQLRREVPEMAKEITAVAKQVGKHRLGDRYGDYNGRA